MQVVIDGTIPSRPRRVTFAAHATLDRIT